MSKILQPIINLIGENEQIIPVYNLQTDTITVHGHLLEGIYTLKIYLTDGNKEVSFIFPEVSIKQSNNEGISEINYKETSSEIQVCLNIIADYNDYTTVNDLHNEFDNTCRTKFGKPDDVKKVYIKLFFIAAMLSFVLVSLWWNLYKPDYYNAKYIAHLNINERDNNTSIIFNNIISDYTLLELNQKLFDTKNKFLDNLIFSKREDIVELKEKIKLFIDTRIGRIDKLKLEIQSKQDSINSKKMELIPVSNEVVRLISLVKKNIVSSQELEYAQQREKSIKYEIASMQSFIQAMQIDMRDLEKGLLLSSNDFSDGMKIPLNKSIEEIFSQYPQLIELQKSLSNLEKENNLVSWCNQCYFVKDYFLTKKDKTLRLLNNKQYVVFAAKNSSADRLINAEVKVDEKKGTVIRILPKDQNQFIGFNQEEFNGFNLSLFLVELYDQTYNYDDGKGKLNLFAEPTEVIVYKK